LRYEITAVKQLEAETGLLESRRGSLLLAWSTHQAALPVNADQVILMVNNDKKALTGMNS